MLILTMEISYSIIVANYVWVPTEKYASKHISKAETNEIDFAHSKNVESSETVLIRLTLSDKTKNNQKTKKKKQNK